MVKERGLYKCIPNIVFKEAEDRLRQSGFKDEKAIEKIAKNTIIDAYLLLKSYGAKVRW